MAIFSTFFFFIKPMTPACTIRANIVQVIFLCNVVSDVFRQHRLDEIPMQCWEPLLQHCTGFLPMQYFPKDWIRIFLVQGCLEPQRQLYIRFFFGQRCPRRWFFRKILHRVRTLCRVSLGVSDNNAQKKIFFDVVWKLLEQHCWGKKPIQCCLKGSRQHWTGKILCNVVLIILGRHYTGKNSVQCYPCGTRQWCTIKNLVQCWSNTLGKTLHRSKPYAMLS